MSRQISRREWLAGTSGALVVAASVSDAQEYRIAGADLKLGVASYSFRKFSREQAIQMTKELGTPYLNVKDFHLALTSPPEQIEAARKQFQDAGLVIVGCGSISFPTDDEADIHRKFDYARRLGAPLIVCAPTHAVLAKLEKFVGEFNIKIAIHNHGPEDKNFPTPQSVLEAVKDMDPRCGLCMDIGHTARTGADIVESISQAGPRLLDMHAKDLADMRVKESQVAVGQGKIPIPRIFQQLIKIKYYGCVNLEYEINENDPMPGMRLSFSYMRGVLSGLGVAQGPAA